MPTLLMCKGLPASGKTSFSKELQESFPYKRVNKDDLRQMLDDSVWSKKNEKFILHIRDEIIKSAILHGNSIIVDDTNLDPKHESRLKELALELGAEFEIQDFTHVPVKECIARDSQREKSVGREVIMKMYNKYLYVEPPKQNSNLPLAIMCDLDGTLALLDGRNPYDASKCYNDDVNESVYIVLHKMNLPVILMSGRSDKYRDETERWLIDHDIQFEVLYMRPERDNRKDCDLKQELYEQFVKDKWNILFVLDDRNQVVDRWRELGLTVFQVAPGDF